MFYGKGFEVEEAYGLCEAEIHGYFTVVGEWNGSATVSVSLKGSETAFDCFTRYDLSSLGDFERAFFDYVQSLLEEGFLNDYINAGLIK